MKSPKFALAIIVLAAAVALLGSGAASPSADRFEYRVVEDTLQPGVLLNQLGAEGWELVAVTTPPAHATTYYVKRRAR